MSTPNKKYKQNLVPTAQKLVIYVTKTNQLTLLREKMLDYFEGHTKAVSRFSL
jgi:hypothetical protein